MPRLARNQRGITIVEIMIAVGILSVGLLALSSAIPLAAYGIQEGNQLSTATFLANQGLEQVRNAQWTACPGVDNLAAAAASATGAPMPAPYAGYSRQVSITDLLGPATCPGGVLTGTTGLRQVTVTVSYRPMTGIGVAPATASKSAVLTMYISQR